MTPSGTEESGIERGGIAVDSNGTHHLVPADAEETVDSGMPEKRRAAYCGAPTRGNLLAPTRARIADADASDDLCKTCREAADLPESCCSDTEVDR